VTTFIGVDLGWYGKPSGLASLELRGGTLAVRSIERLEETSSILAWIEAQAPAGDCVIAVDAPLVIPNPTGIRECERELNRDFQRYHAGCHAANLGRPFAKHVTGFSQALERLGFRHGATIKPRQPGRFQIEVHPHAASVNLFDLPRIIKYKRGRRADRAIGLRRLRKLMIERLPLLNPAVQQVKLPGLPRTGPLKPAEDQIDAVLCSYIAAHYWRWGRSRNHVYGDGKTGYIVVPDRLVSPFGI